MRLMGMALLHFLWQGAAIAAVAFMGWFGAARVGEIFGRVAMLALMVAAPAVTLLGAGKAAAKRRVFPSIKRRRGTATSPGIVATEPVASGSYFSGAVEAEKTSSVYLLWFVELWFLGVVLLSLRPAAGFFLIGRLRLKKATPMSGRAAIALPGIAAAAGIEARSELLREFAVGGACGGGMVPAGGAVAGCRR